jgi:hypothetical protein
MRLNPCSDACQFGFYLGVGAASTVGFAYQAYIYMMSPNEDETTRLLHLTAAAGTATVAVVTLCIAHYLCRTGTPKRDSPLPR